MKHASIDDLVAWVRYHSRPIWFTTTGKRPCPYCEHRPKENP